MNYIDDFNEGEVVLDYKNSSDKALKELSNCCPAYKRYGYTFYYTVYEYAHFLLEKMLDYDFIFYDENFKCYNAYTGEAAKQYLTSHQMMTAEEILGCSSIEIKESEFQLMFE